MVGNCGARRAAGVPVSQGLGWSSVVFLSVLVSYQVL